MIAIQVLLIVFFGFMLIRVIAGPNNSKFKAWKKIVAIVFMLLAVAAVLFPGLLDRAAHAVGVGRGADLLLYTQIVTFLAYILNQYLRSKESERQLHQLARKVAILEANSRARS